MLRTEAIACDRFSQSFGSNPCQTSATFATFTETVRRTSKTSGKLFGELWFGTCFFSAFLVGGCFNWNWVINGNYKEKWIPLNSNIFQPWRGLTQAQAEPRKFYWSCRVFWLSPDGSIKGNWNRVRARCRAQLGCSTKCRKTDGKVGQHRTADGQKPGVTHFLTPPKSLLWLS